MRNLTTLVLGILLLSISGCALSPAREVLKKGDTRLSISLGGALVDQVSGIENIPLPLNLSAGVFYGLTDYSTVGFTLYPMSLATGGIYYDVTAVGNLVQTNFVKQLNVSLGFPTKIQFNQFSISTFPTMEICPVFGNNSWDAYTVLSIQLDFGDPFKTHVSWKIGGEYQAFEKASIGMEAGLMNIGEESVASPASRAGIGVPVFTIGTAIDMN